MISKDYKVFPMIINRISLILIMTFAIKAQGRQDESEKTQFKCIGSFGEAIPFFSLVGHVVYAAGGYTLRAIDISNPEKPKLIGWAHMQQPIVSLDARGSAVYVGMGNGGGAWLVDASNPKSLR